MVLCVMEDLVLDEGVTVEHVTFEVSKHTSFKEVELTSKDMDCKGLAIFNKVLDPNIKWYARARALLSTGMTVWGNVDTFESTIDTDQMTSLDMPSRVSVPQITTNSLQSTHDVTMFTIQVEGFRVVGNASHYATTYIIEDQDGKVVWSLLKSTINLTSITVSNIILKSNAIYRIKVIFHSSSNDVSPVGSYTICTADNSAINITSFIDVVDNREPLDIEIDGIEGVKKVAWEIVSIAGGVTNTVWKTFTDASSPNLFATQVPALTLKEAEMYMIKVTTDRQQDGSKFLSFNTVAHSEGMKATLEEELNGGESGKILTEYEQFRLDSFKNNNLFLTSSEYKAMLELGGDEILDIRTATIQELLDYAPVEFWLDRYCASLHAAPSGIVALTGNTTRITQGCLWYTQGYYCVECTRCFLENQIKNNIYRIKFLVANIKRRISEDMGWIHSKTIPYVHFYDYCRERFTKEEIDIGSDTELWTCAYWNGQYRRVHFCKHMLHITHWWTDGNIQLHMSDFMFNNTNEGRYGYLDFDPMWYYKAKTKQPLIPTDEQIQDALLRVRRQNRWQYAYEYSNNGNMNR